MNAKKITILGFSFPDIESQTGPLLQLYCISATVLFGGFKFKKAVL